MKIIQVGGHNCWREGLSRQLQRAEVVSFLCARHTTFARTSPFHSNFSEVEEGGRFSERGKVGTRGDLAAWKRKKKKMVKLSPLAHQASAHADSVWSVAWSAGNDLLLTGSVDENVKSWRASGDGLEMVHSYTGTSLQRSEAAKRNKQKK